jgi:isocitrate dehydrogenase (NAD+)
MSNDKRHKVTLISGDGIGPEVIDAAKKIIEATGVKIEWEIAPAGSQALAKYKRVLPEIVFESIKKNTVCSCPQGACWHAYWGRV